MGFPKKWYDLTPKEITTMTQSTSASESEYSINSDEWQVKLELDKDLFEIQLNADAYNKHLSNMDNLAIHIMEIFLKHQGLVRRSIINKIKHFFGIKATAHLDYNYKGIARESYLMAMAMADAKRIHDEILNEKIEDKKSNLGAE